MSHRARGPARRLHALNTLFAELGRAVVPNSCDLVVIDGGLEHERLRGAIQAALERHPILCSPMAGEGATARWREPEPALPVDLRFHTLASDDPRNLEDHLLGLIWDEPLLPDGRPVRFHVTETPARTYLQTIHTHVFADATACYLLTEDIAAAYGRAPCRRSSSRAPERARTEVQHRGLGELFGGALTRRERLVLRARGLALTLRDLSAARAGLAPSSRSGRGEPAPGRRALARFVLDTDETRQLRAAARARGCSIHAFFQLAFLRAASGHDRRHGVVRRSLRLWDFFSLRPLATDARGVYDCLALLYPVELDPRRSDDETLARCTRAVERMRERDLLVHAYRFDSLFRVLGPVLPSRWFARVWPALFKSDVLLTNPGVCPSRLESFGGAEVLDYVTFPQLFAPADLMFVFSTFREQLRILVVYDRDALGDTLHEELLEPFLRELGALASLDLVRASVGAFGTGAGPARRAAAKGRIDGVKRSA